VKKNLVLISTVLVGTAMLADASLGNTSMLAAAGPKRRVSGTVNTTTRSVEAPIVHMKIEATNTWVAEPADTMTTTIVKTVEEPVRPFIPVFVAMTSFDCNNNGIPDTIDIANGAIDSDNDGIIDRCETGLGDLNLNGVIDSFDVSILLGWWGMPNPLYGDLNSDGAVNAFDLGILLGRFGVATY
jgi:hypothetical protein